MIDSNRPATTGLDRDTTSTWDLIPADGAPSKAIVMRFASYEAGHAVLVGAGFTPASGSVRALRLHDGRTAVKYTHPDGSAVVLAHSLAEHDNGQKEPLR